MRYTLIRFLKVIFGHDMRLSNVKENTDYWWLFFQIRCPPRPGTTFPGMPLFLSKTNLYNPINLTLSLTPLCHILVAPDKLPINA